jgi:hypothetical protein
MLTQLPAERDVTADDVAAGQSDLRADPAAY